MDDAWDSGDDEFCTVSDVRISKKVSHSVALSVIDSHRQSGVARMKEPLKDSLKALPRTHGRAGHDVLNEISRRLPTKKIDETEAVHLKNHVYRKTSEPNQMLKKSMSENMRHNHFPGRPLPMRQSNSTGKFFVPSKEQGLYCKISVLNNNNQVSDF